MKWKWTIPAFSVIGLTVVATLWWRSGVGDRPAPPSPSTAPAGALRLGLVPEQDVFALRKSYGELADYLAAKLGMPVQLATLNTYDGVLRDFDEGKIDGAFLGSLVALLAIDRHGAQVLVKPQQPDGVSTYRGVIFVRDDSPVRGVDELAGQTIAMIRTTTAGSLFPAAELSQRGVLGGKTPPRFLWAGTHDEVIAAVMEGKAAAGAVKDLRLTAWLAAHPEQAVRRLAIGEAVPNNALVLRRDVAQRLGPAMQRILLEMDRDERGREVLARFGAARFVLCDAGEYAPILDMIEKAGPGWSQVGIAGPLPRRPATLPATTRPQ